MALASNVLDTAISVTDARSRRASRQACAISCSTTESPFGERGVIDNVLSGAMSSIRRRFYGLVRILPSSEKASLFFLSTQHAGVGGSQCRASASPAIESNEKNFFGSSLS